MLQTLWKLTFLAGVVGIGLLVVVQAKKGMQFSPEQENSQENSSVATGSDAAPEVKPAVTPSKSVAPKKSVASAAPKSPATSAAKAAEPKLAKAQKKVPTRDLFEDELPDEPAPSVRPVAAQKSEGESKKGIKVLNFIDDQPEEAAPKSAEPKQHPAHAAKGKPHKTPSDRVDLLDFPTSEEPPARATAGSKPMPLPDEIDSEAGGPNVLPTSGSSPPTPPAGATAGAPKDKPHTPPTAAIKSPGTDPFAPKTTADTTGPDSVELPEVTPVTPAAPVKPAASPRQPMTPEEDDVLPVVPRGTPAIRTPPATTPPAIVKPAPEKVAPERTIAPGLAPRDDADGFGVPPTTEPEPALPVAPPASVKPTPPANTLPALPTPAAPAAEAPIPVLPRQPPKTVGDPIPQPEAVTPAPVKPRQRPRVKIEKSAPPNATLGQPMIYHIHVKNLGDVAAHQIIVQDTVPKGVNLDGTIPQAELVGDVLTWKMGSLEPRSEKKISIRVVPVTEGEVGSVATVKFSAEPGPLPLGAAPRLEFELIGPPQTTLGAPTNFTFRVANVGRADAHSVVIRNVLPPGLRHGDGDDLEYEIGLLPAGKSRDVTLTLNAAQLGRTVNRAVVTADGGISVSAQSPIEIVSPNLSIQRSGPAKLLLNRQATFTNTVTNASVQGVKNVTITETIPGGFEFQSATNEGRYDSTKRVVSWTIDQLGSQQSRAVQLSLKSVGRGSQVSVVRAFDGQGATGEAVGTTHIAGVAAVSIDMSDIPASLEVGQQTTFKVRIRNRGTDSADNVRVSLTLPTGTELVSLNGGKHRRSGDEVMFEPIPRLEPKHDAIIELTLKGVHPQETRLQVQIQNEATGVPLRRDEAFSVITP